MVCKINSFVLEGLDAVPVTVEVDVRQGLPGVYIIGLGDRAVLESRLRVAAAIRNSGYSMPQQKVVVNLAPADRHKYGTALDLPIALGILGASRQIPEKIIKDFLRGSALWGELSLLGAVNHVRGAISVAMAAKACGIQKLYLPDINAKEAGMVAGIDLFPVISLAGLLEDLRLDRSAPKISAVAPGFVKYLKPLVDFSEIRGQEKAKRALEIAAAGNHNILLSGPPGAGKTVLCQALSGILPPLNPEELITVLQIRSVTGGDLTPVRPFRAPHHSATLAAIIGGGARLNPGEITLAHNGVLFFDECNRFSSAVLDALREPLEQGRIRLSRNNVSAVLPAGFIFAAAINPCPCGNWGSKSNQCRCTAAEISRFSRKLSAPLLDRIELQIQVESIAGELFDIQKQPECSALILKRVKRAKEFQRIRNNSGRRLTIADLNDLQQLSEKARRLLESAVANLNLSNRGLLRLLNVSRTIADLRQAEQIDDKDVAEAAGYRLD